MKEYIEIKKGLESLISEKALDPYDDHINILFENLEKAEQEAHYNKISLMLDNCDRIRSNVELIQSISQTETSGDYINGITNSKKIKIYLLGSFSSGKTTFINRILNKAVGVSSEFPETSTIIRHFGSSSKLLEIIPEQEYAPPPSEKIEFTKALKQFDLEKYFFQKGDQWIREEENITISDWEISNLKDFMGKIKNYPMFISKIEWGHTLKDKNNIKYNLFDYAELYDIPGIGGDEEHEPIIGKALKSFPDVIIYLLDPQNGIPGENEEKYLIDIVNNCNSALFFWCYQKVSENIDKESRSKDISEFIDNMIEKRKGKVDIDKIAKYYENPIIIDAIGGLNENFTAIEELAKIISLYFLNKVQKFVKNKKERLTNIPERPEILPKNHNYRDPQHILAAKLLSISESEEVRVADLRRQLSAIFSDELINNFESRQEIKEFDSFMYKQTQDLKDFILSKSAYHLTSNYEKLKNRFIGRGKDKDEKRLCSFDFLKLGFTDLYKNSTKLQIGLPLLQAYILFILYYGNQLERIYLKDFESHILEQIEKDMILLNMNINS